MKFRILLFLLPMLACTNSVELEKKFTEYGLVNIHDVDPSIQVELKYTMEDNFTGHDMYGNLKEAYFVPEIAQMLKEAQELLHETHPEYNLVIYDAARPLCIQAYMFEFVKGTEQEKYVANPAGGGGYHNYGIAVDLTISDKEGKPLDMGTPFDSFDAMANVGNEEYYVREGKMTSEALENRRLLKGIMETVGFEQNPDEWWHFQKYSKEELQRNFRLLDF